MNTNEISEKIRDHLTKQKARSVRVTKEGSLFCQYRSDDGCMCAVGVLIADGAYCHSLEGKTATEDVVLEALSKSGVDLTTDYDMKTEIITSWQLYHDRSTEQFSYSEWIQGDEAQSPAAFHKLLMGE